MAFTDNMGNKWENVADFIKFLEEHDNGVGIVIPEVGDNLLWKDSILAEANIAARKSRYISIGITAGACIIYASIPLIKWMRYKYLLAKERAEEIAREGKVVF